MRSGLTGTGSTLIVLVFSILCLTIFALISLSTASMDKSLADAGAQAAKEYYEADLLAEYIIAEIVEAETPPENIRRVDIYTGTDTAEFSCPLSGDKELYVKIALSPNSYEVLEWRLRDTEDWLWEIDEPLPVWSGD